jgi:hypothetical protein
MFANSCPNALPTFSRRQKCDGVSNEEIVAITLHFGRIMHYQIVVDYVVTQTSFIIMSNKGRLPASGLGAKRQEWSNILT